jgi:hypothetical protein
MHTDQTGVQTRTDTVIVEAGRRYDQRANTGSQHWRIDAAIILAEESGERAPKFGIIYTQRAAFCPSGMHRGTNLHDPFSGVNSGHLI